MKVFLHFGNDEFTWGCFAKSSSFDRDFFQIDWLDMFIEFAIVYQVVFLSFLLWVLGFNLFTTIDLIFKSIVNKMKLNIRKPKAQKTQNSYCKVSKLNWRLFFWLSEIFEWKLWHLQSVARRCGKKKGTKK